MALNPQNLQAAHILRQIRPYENRKAQGYTGPFPISVQPYSSSGQPKQWVQTPGVGAFGTYQGPGWYSPAPQLTLPGQRYRKRKATRKGKSNRRRATRRRR